jgi:hypothetical protein
VRELRKIVTEVRDSLTPAPSETPETTPEVAQTDAVDTPATPEVAQVEPVKIISHEGPITVICKNGAPSRVYSREKDGAVYKSLAKNYAEHNDGTML